MIEGNGRAEMLLNETAGMLAQAEYELGLLAERLKDLRERIEQYQEN